ncbi:hypothetical protein COAQ111491_13780 [Comamonas aquatilis]|uniref:polysaccharide pyruvyl transferase family protein n=1 Tax=Comamonas aquatilis TaxID=1778406 RepID=UPI0039F03C4B
MKTMNLKIYKNLDLVPEEWKRAREQASAGIGTDWYVFNPTLARVGDVYVMTYRVVDEVLKTRRIASCKLTLDLLIVPDSVTPLSDLIEFSDAAGFSERTLTWHADPRYFRLGKDLYLFWNDGSLKPANHQFLLQIGQDGLKPAGKARLVRKEPHELRIEKNWQFIEAEKSVYAVYENRPLHLLSVDMSGNGVIPCREAVKTDWMTGYEEKFGHIRGGAQPVLHDNSFLTLAHSSHKNSHGKLVYHPCFYRFESSFPFRVTHRPKGPFTIPIHGYEKPRLPPLNKQTSSVVYPCGLVVENERAVISFGINDESCAVGFFNMTDIMNSMESVDEPAAFKKSAVPAGKTAALVMTKDDQRVPLFWWNAQGKRYDPDAGGRFFATGNVGDIASRLFVEMLSNVETRPPRKNERKLLSIGSILQNAADGDVVWGSGIKGSADGFKYPVHELSVHAVRGPLTVDFLRRQGISLTHLNELFDPGCLIPYLYAKELGNTVPRKRKICIIPHYKDDLILRQQHPDLSGAFLSVDAMPLDFIKGMLGAELVISSSLHGIIFAEALGIHALWLAPINGEDELKYYDYYYGTGRYNVKRFTTVESALRAEPMDLPRFRFEDYLRTFPHEAIRGLCKTPPDTVRANWIQLPAAADSPAPVALLASKAFTSLTNRVVVQRPPSLNLTEAITAFRSRQYEAGVSALLLAWDGAMVSHDVSLQSTVEKAAFLYLGCRDLGAIAGGIGSDVDSITSLHTVIVDAIHQSPMEEVAPKLMAVIREKVASTSSGTFWHLLQALVMRKLGKLDEEADLLKAASVSEPLNFWTNVQQVYRFTVDLPSLNHIVGCVRSKPQQFVDEHESLKVYCYPSFNKINSYQKLLYQKLEASGKSVRYCSKLTELEMLKREPGKTQLLHLHWTSAFFKDVDAVDFSRRASYVLDLLSRLKAEGFSLAWTIHNTISHESVDSTNEESFNRNLYSLCDWVFVHHPMAVRAITWLPDTNKIHLIEHGSYGSSDSTDRLTARIKLGLNFDGPLLSAIGHMRDYKELDKCLPMVLDVLNKRPDARFLVAGQIQSPALRRLLSKKKRDQVIVIDRVLSPEELHLCIDATDFGLLSYRDVLTSGSLIHWLSRGIPVIAPQKGTIPGYVLDGWNGFLYGSYESLSNLVHQCLAMPPERRACLRSNALATGKGMQWQLF